MPIFGGSSGGGTVDASTVAAAGAVMTSALALTGGAASHKPAWDTINLIFKNFPDGVFDLRHHGGVGNSTANDTAAWQSAVDNAAAYVGQSGVTGGKVRVPIGDFGVREPVVVDRTESTPQGVVIIEGEHPTRSIISGHSTLFPEGRALLEWSQAGGAVRAWDQSVKTLTFRLPPIADTRAIHYERVNTDTIHGTGEGGTGYQAERLKLNLHEIHIMASNQWHPDVIRVEGGIWFSKWIDIVGHFSQNTWAYDTLLFHLDSGIDLSEDMAGSPNEPGWTTDVPGFAYGEIRNVISGGRTGGKSRMWKGRILRSEMVNAFANGGLDPDSINYDFISCVSNTLDHLGNEGLDEGVQFRFTNARFNDVREINLGTPDSEQIGAQFINSTDNLIRGRLGYANQPVFSTVDGSQVVHLDEDSHRNRFENFAISVGAGGVADEITDLGTDNYFWGVADADAQGGGTPYTFGTDPYASAGGGLTEEEVDDRVAALVAAGNGLVETYDDGGNLLTIGREDPATVIDLIEEFHGGSTSSGQIGQHGWSAINGSRNVIAGVAGHPGIIEISTTATINTLTAIGLTSATNIGMCLASENFDIIFGLRLMQVDANTTVRCGVATNIIGNPSNDGVWFERLGADTNWFMVTRASSSQNRVDTTVAAGTGWIWFRIRRVDATTVGFRTATTKALLDAATEVTSNHATVPTTAAVSPFVFETNLEAAAKLTQVDWSRWRVSEISR